MGAQPLGEDLVRLTNTLLEKATVTRETLAAVDNVFTRLGGDVLGVVKSKYTEEAGAHDEAIGALVGLLIEQRANARQAKDFATADAVRDKLDEAGIVLEDKPEGTQWRWK